MLRGNRMDEMTYKFACATALVLAAGSAFADDQAMVDYVNGNLRALMQDPTVQASIRASNIAHAALTPEQIIALDTQWRAEVGAAATPTISGVLDSSASAMLRDAVEASGGAVTEIIVVDNVGLNAATSSVTSDFWQGDEAKYLDTYPKGADALHVSEIELDESSQTYQAQVSFTITAADTGEPIGAVTVGMNAEMF